VPNETYFSVCNLGTFDIKNVFLLSSIKIIQKKLPWRINYLLKVQSVGIQVCKSKFKSRGRVEYIKADGEWD
jgi:hypothetical protein